MGNAELEGCAAGVAFFGKSLEADLAAFVWAYKHLPLSEKYKLRIIHVNKLNNGNQTRERPGYSFPLLFFVLILCAICTCIQLNARLFYPY